MAGYNALTLLFVLLLLGTQALELRAPTGRRSKRDLVETMFSYIKKLDKRLVSLDNSTEERLSGLEAKMDGELQEKLKTVEENQRDTKEKLQTVQESVQRLETMVLELLSSRLESMVTQVLEARLGASGERLAEMEAKTNATGEGPASPETSDPEAQARPASCGCQFEKEAPCSSVDLQRMSKLEIEVTRLRERVSALDKRQQENDHEFNSLRNASMQTFGDVVRSVRELVTASEQNLKSTIENNNPSMLNASLARMDSTTTNLATSMSAVEERMAATEDVLSATREATESLATKMSVTESRLVAGIEDNMAVLNVSMATLTQTNEELSTRLSALADRLDNSTSHQAEASCEDFKRQIEELKNRTSEQRNPPRTCQDYYNRGERTSGIYTLQLRDGQGPMDVFCDMSRAPVWLVIQRREDGTANFYRDYKSYQNGFGVLTGEFWLGNENIHRLTSAGLKQLKVELRAWNGSTAFASYAHFHVGSSPYYTLSVSGYSGTAGDGLTFSSGQKFSTWDRDQDSYGGNCAQDWKGAWWYRACGYSSLNGEYGARGSSGGRYVTWYHWLGYQSLQRTEMKVK